MLTDFWRQSAKIGIPHLNSLHWHSTEDARVNTADDPSKSDKKFGKLWSSDPRVVQARVRRAGYTLGFTTHF